MSWWQYLLGFAVTSSVIALALLVIASGLWLQGWLAGRKYCNSARPDPWGTLHGFLDVRFLRSATGEDRLVKVLESSDLIFERPNGQCIPMTAGRISDGESAPALFWPLTGGPLNGRSRDATVGVHDELCFLSARAMTSDEAHGVCYEAMRSRGLWWRGPIKHAVLLNWGSRW